MASIRATDLERTQTWKVVAASLGIHQRLLYRRTRIVMSAAKFKAGQSAHLIEVAIVTARKLVKGARKLIRAVGALEHHTTTFIVERRILALRELIVAKVEIRITSISLFPVDCVFFWTEFRRIVKVSIEADKIGHCREGVVKHDIHAPTVYFVNCGSPFINLTKVAIE